VKCEESYSFEEFLVLFEFSIMGMSDQCYMNFRSPLRLVRTHVSENLL
jgi:hypothetical protein